MLSRTVEQSLLSCTGGDDPHTAHFYGGSWDGRTILMDAPVPDMILTLTHGDPIYKRVVSTGSTVDAECRDHIYRAADP